MSRFSPVIAWLVERGWFEGDELLPGATTRALEKEAKDLWSAGSYRLAGIGRERSHAVRPEIRGDSIHWVGDEHRTEPVEAYRATIDELRLELNEELYLGLESFEIQYARYPAGAHYARHIDRFSDQTLRTISCILYLNSMWQPGDGGELRLHLEGRHHDVIPRAGTWVVFRSELIEHEVRPARRERYSLTGWFRRRP